MLNACLHCHEVIVNARLDIIPSGYFVATPPSVGCTCEELSEHTAGMLTIERRREIQDNLQKAALALAASNISGCC